MTKRKGLNQKDHGTMMDLARRGKSAKAISEWMQVDLKYVRDNIPKKPRKKKVVEESPKE